MSSNLTEAWIPGPKSLSFYTRTYQPTSGSPRGAVVFIHGFIEHVARYEHVHRRWADRGFVVFTFDQRGFGRTALDPKKSAGSVYGRTGDADQIADIEWALRVAQEANPTVPLFLMGHSMVRSLSLFFFFSFFFWALLRGFVADSDSGWWAGLVVRDACQYTGQRVTALRHYRIEPLSSSHQATIEHRALARQPRARHPS